MLNNFLFQKFTGRIDTKHIWWFNIGAESLWNENQPSILPQITNKGNARTVNRTEQICLLLAADGDIIIQREKPSDLLLYNLQRIGFGNPEIYVLENCGNEDEQCSISELILKNGKLITKLRNLNSQGPGNKVELAPYAITHFEEEISLKSGYRLIGAPTDITSWVNSKVNTRTLAEDLGLPVTEGYICYTIEELKTAINSLRNSSGGDRIVVKEAYGASGKGLFIVDSEKAYQLLMTILDRKSNRGKAVELIVERWYDTLIDLNYQIYINESGCIHYIPPKRQINKVSVYVGSEFPITDELTDHQKEYYEECAMMIGHKLWQKDYYGFASIDSIITKEDKIIPIVEINGRLSLSTYISFVPEMLGNDKVYRNRYYNLKPGITLERIMEDIGAYNYSHEKGVGMIIYSFVEGIQGISEGRLFSLFVAKKQNTLDLFEAKLNSILYDN